MFVLQLARDLGLNDRGSAEFLDELQGVRVVGSAQEVFVRLTFLRAL